MPTTSLQARAPQALGFPGLLRDWRRRRRLSQLDLSLTAGISQRHLSYLETGRSKPSRDMVLLLSEALDVPLRERNGWLFAAGFAPLFRARGLDEPEMAQVLGAVRMMLQGHEPFPALAVDRAWNVRLSNEAFARLVGLLSGEPGMPPGGPELNLLRLFFLPTGIRRSVANWGAIAPLLWQRACREAEASGGQDLQAVLAEVAPALENDAFAARREAPLFPVLPLVLQAGGATLSLFSVIATFGTAQDVTADELRIESFFPADAATAEALRRMAEGP